MQCVLQDAETKQISATASRSWLQKLKYVAYNLEDLLEEWRILEIDEVTTSPSTNCFGDQVRNSSSVLNSLPPIRQLEYLNRVDEIKRRLEQIAQKKVKVSDFR